MTEWGPKIEVDGKRPEWLRDDDWRAMVMLDNGDIEEPSEEFTMKKVGDWQWYRITKIRLPAEHPYYKQDVPDWAKVRCWDETCPDGGHGDEYKIRWVSEDPRLMRFARYIAQHEQPPVGQLLKEAREIAAIFWRSRGDYSTAKDIEGGKGDDTPSVQSVLFYMKRKADAKKG